MLPLEMADKARACPGKILVEREEMPDMAGGLWLPPGYRKHTLSSTAKVVDYGRWNFSPGGPLPSPIFCPGQRVVLSASAGKPIAFGARGERTLWSVSPEQIMLILTDQADTKLDANPMRAMNGEIHNPDLADVVDEGDSRGLR